MFDFLLFCREKRIPYLTEGHHHCHEGWIQTHCPFCGSGAGGWHLGFQIGRDLFHCWRCGGKGLWNGLSGILHTKDSALIKAILKQYGNSLEVPKARGTFVPRSEAVPPPGAGPLSRIHRAYLKGRGFNPDELVQTWGLSATGAMSDQWRWRIVAPIRNAGNYTLGYTARSISPHAPLRWKTSDKADAAGDPHAFLYGLEQAQGERVLVVEGPSDVWRMGPGAVGVLGIDWKRPQANQLRHFPKRYIMFDPEPQAQRQAEKLAEWLSPFPGETEIIEGLDNDPGDMEPEAARKIMKHLGF